MFQFTHPGRGATGSATLWIVCSSRFQFTHPGRGATSTIASIKCGQAGFNSRTPGGVRRHKVKRNVKPIMFQFTHPGRGATCAIADMSYDDISFNSRTPGGVRRSR